LADWMGFPPKFGPSTTYGRVQFDIMSLDLIFIGFSRRRLSSKIIAIMSREDKIGKPVPKRNTQENFLQLNDFCREIPNHAPLCRKSCVRAFMRKLVLRSVHR
jgi:hypothetical protein